MTTRYEAVVFDLLTGLLDSWTLWSEVAGSEEAGLRWRRAYLQITYGTGTYRPYEDLVIEAARLGGVPVETAAHLVSRWDELAPWPEAPAVLRALRDAGLRIAVVTNCSEILGARAASALGVPLDVVVTAERAGYYKPNPHPYRLALDELRVHPDRALFVAGSPGDVPGASAVGMPVVWHNRIGLTPVESAARPLATYSTLHPLLQEILGSAG